MEVSLEFDMEWDESVVYAEDAWINGPVQAIQDEELEMLKNLPGRYPRFILLISSEFAKSLPSHR